MNSLQHNLICWCFTLALPVLCHYTGTLSFEEITFSLGGHKQAASVMARVSSFYRTEYYLRRTPQSPSCLLGFKLTPQCCGKGGSCVLSGNYTGTLSVHTAAGHQKIPNHKPCIYLQGGRGQEKEKYLINKDSNRKWEEWQAQLKNPFCI